MKLSTILSLRCPVCEKGKIFHSYFDTPERCPSCGFYFMRENGYFLPHVAIGYSLIVTVTLSIWPLLKYGLGITSDAILLTTMILTGLVLDYGPFAMQRCYGSRSTSPSIRRYLKTFKRAVVPTGTTDSTRQMVPTMAGHRIPSAVPMAATKALRQSCGTRT